MTTVAHRDEAASPWTREALLAVGVALVLCLVVAASGTGTDVTPSPLAYGFAVGFGAVLLLRRIMPVAVVVLSVLGTFAYYTLDLPPIGIALPVVAALYSAAEAGLLQWTVGAGAVVFAVSLYFRLRDDPRPVGSWLGTESVANIALIAAAIALGYAVRLRRLRAAQQEQIARLRDEQAGGEAQLRVQTERERISRELHDTLGHTLAVISLHANVGREALGRDDREVGTALDEVAGQSSASLQELRSMVRLLRDDARDQEVRHVRSLADVQQLVDQVVAAGVDVRAHVEAMTGLPRAVDTAAYMVVQESLTNVLRHAHARSATVEVSRRDDRVRITVTDDGRGARDGGRPGYGITGMTERVRLLGGSLATSSAPGEGFTVDATLPARLDS